LGHLSNGLDDPQQIFFTNAKILTLCLVGLRRKQFYFFYIGAVPSPPYFQRIGKNFTFFFSSIGQENASKLPPPFYLPKSVKVMVI